MFLQAAGGDQKGSHQVTYPYFTAFINLLNNMELVKRIYTSATKGNTARELTKGECWLLGLEPLVDWLHCCCVVGIRSLLTLHVQNHFEER